MKSKSIALTAAGLATVALSFVGAGTASADAATPTNAKVTASVERLGLDGAPTGVVARVVNNKGIGIVVEM